MLGQIGRRDRIYKSRRKTRNILKQLGRNRGNWWRNIRTRRETRKESIEGEKLDIQYLNNSNIHHWEPN